MRKRTGITRRELLGRTSAGLALLGGAGLTYACAPSPGRPTPLSKSPKGTLTVGLGGQSFETMDSMQGITVTGAIYKALYESLRFVDTVKGGAISPELATSWKQIDPLTWEFALRRDVKFHNGEPFDASSAEFSLQIALQDKTTFAYTFLSNIAKTEIVDPSTLRVVTKTPDVLTLGNLGTRMYPKNYYQSVGAAGFGKKPVGTGPWKFDNWDDGVAVTVTRFDGYWGKKPPFERIIFRPISEASTRLAALLSGEIDIAHNLNVDDVKVLEAKGFLAVGAPQGQGTGVSMVYLGGQPKGTPISKKQVRQALNYAVDKDAIAKDIMLGSTSVLKGQIVGPDCFGFNPNLTAYPYDPAKAKQLLTEAGYPNGFSVDFQAAGANYAKAQEVSENVVAQLAKVGVTVKLQMLEWNLFLDKLLGASSTPLLYIGWNYHPQMDAHFAYRNFVTSSRFKMASNARMDALHEAQLNEFDRDKREKLLQEFASVMRDEAPFLYLFQSPMVYGVNPRVQGFQSTGDTQPSVLGLSLTD